MTRAHGSGGLLIRSVRLPTEEDAAQEQCFPRRAFRILVGEYRVGI